MLSSLLLELWKTIDRHICRICVRKDFRREHFFITFKEMSFLWFSRVTEVITIEHIVDSVNSVKLYITICVIYVYKRILEDNMYGK